MGLQLRLCAYIVAHLIEKVCRNISDLVVGAMTEDHCKDNLKRGRL